MSTPKKKKPRKLAQNVTDLVDATQREKDQKHEQISIDGKDNAQCLTVRSKTIRTLEEALATCQVDQKLWEVERWLCNKWDMGAKLELQPTEADPRSETLAAMELWQVKVWFRRKKDINVSIEMLLDDLRNLSPIVLPIKYRKPLVSKKRALELCLFDAHLGMHCFPPGADCAWSIEDCEEIYMWALNGLLAAAEPYGPFDEIVFPFGNDYLHVDNEAAVTTAGTAQPEADCWYHIFARGKKLAITAIDLMKQIAPVKIYQIPGNHDRCSSYALGHILDAYYHNDKNVDVDATANTYKFWRYGTNLIGFDHGHSVAQVRLAALMANECAEFWNETTYREWHCGDQHRKASAKPMTFEEQGVSVEYLPALTPPNVWHRRKSFNWQKRGALAFVYDHDTGPLARLQVNINSYTGRPTGEKSAKNTRIAA